MSILKQLLCDTVTLALPDQYGRFGVKCDASDKVVSSYLEQIDKEGHMRPAAFGGKKLSKAEQNYSTTESCDPRGRKFDLYTDHESLKWLLTRTQDHSGRLWR